MENLIYDWVIYKITSPSGKIYIGKTSNYKKRVTYYRNNKSLSQPRLYGSFNKYGFDKHDIIIIDEFQGDNSLCNEKEIFWIGLYKSNCCKYKDGNGLNLTDGGQGTIGYKASDELKKRLSEVHKGLPSSRLGAKLSEDHKQKLRDYFTGRPNLKRRNTKPSSETLKKMSESRKGKPNFKRRGIKVSEESRLKMSLAKKGKAPPNKGKPMSLQQREFLSKIRKGKPSWNKGKKFEGTDEERKVKFGSHNIGNTYNKGRIQKPEFVAERVKRQTGKPNISLYKPILQFDLQGNFIKEHISLKAAHADTKVDISSIYDIAKGNTKNPRYFIFRYKEVS